MGKTLFRFDTDKEWDYENGFYLTSHVTRLAKILAHFELYKAVVELPGHVVECGVYKGASLIQFATFREVLESPFSRRIVGFDAFGKFPIHKSTGADAEFVDRFERAGGEGISRAELEDVLEHKGLHNVELVGGDILETVPRYVADHPELRIALLHVDVDVYEPSAVILEHLWERIVPGGIAMFDDYGTVAGETRAIDEFFAGKRMVIKKPPISHIPAYVTK